jgi:hypothetical protein
VAQAGVGILGRVGFHLESCQSSRKTGVTTFTHQAHDIFVISAKSNERALFLNKHLGHRSRLEEDILSVLDPRSLDTAKNPINKTGREMVEQAHGQYGPIGRFAEEVEAIKKVSSAASLY